MKKTQQLLALTLLTIVSTNLYASPYIGTGQYFVEPGSWSVGDLNSTYQAWDNFVSPAANNPDAGYNTNPAIGTNPVLGAAGAILTGTQNFYAFAANYSINADIYNHSTGGTDGTHVIVQTTATTYGGVSVVPGSLEIVDLGGAPLLGGSNGAALVNGGLLTEGIVNSTFGPSNLQVKIWEFFLPNYTGDFKVQFDESIHSSFDQMRVDSLITASALPATPFTFKAIPEPTSLALGLLGMVGIGLRRNRKIES